MKNNIATIYVPIKSVVTTADGYDHVIEWLDTAVSRETYEKRQTDHSKKIDSIISPVLKDLYDLREEIMNDDFDCHVDGNEVIITHRYCPTLNKSECRITRKEYKGYSYNQKVASAKDELIKHINSEINLREEARDELIGNFSYHPLQVTIDELKKMIADAENETNYDATNNTEDGLDEFDELIDYNVKK